MAKLSVLAMLVLLSSVGATPPQSAGGLAVGFYDSTCSNAENIVRGVVEKAVRKNPGTGAGLIRMLFHDCFVQGCDGSLLLDPTPQNPQPEKLSPPNLPSPRGFEVIDTAKAALEAACPANVSCADIVAFAARDASAVLSDGNVNFTMPAGRRDGRVSSANDDTLNFLPPPSFNLSELTASFASKGLDADDLGVLSNVLFTSDAAPLKPVQTAVGEQKFANAMVKMASIDVKTGTNGEIRKNCRAVN
ncbi:unnamed protein product [Urochloa decumbens]|uniref:Plant heme peroxidase family profile domain-containing protein n=1 Tax=Urochloa decumbens TaxID=240449 RepID=A0ABC9FB91_9POAL